LGICAAALSLMSLPALDGSVVLTGAHACIGRGCRDDDWRWRHRRGYGYGWERGGCRDVTAENAGTARS
jgi:hypothetical protein